MRRNGLPPATGLFLRRNRRTEPRQFGAFRDTFRKSPVALDCVVVVAVIYEPVSGLEQVPNYGKFWPILAEMSRR
jgi:hypothetical protein